MQVKLTYLALYQDNFTSKCTKVVLQLQADTLRNISTSSHYGLVGRAMIRQKEQDDGIFQKELSVWRLYLVAQRLIKIFEVTNNAMLVGYMFQPHTIFTPNMGKINHPHGKDQSPDQPNTQPMILPCFLSLVKIVLERTPSY